MHERRDVNSAEHASGGVVNAQQRIHTYPTVDQGHMPRVAQVLAERCGPNERSRESARQWRRASRQACPALGGRQ